MLQRKGLTENDHLVNIEYSYNRCIENNIKYRGLMADTVNDSETKGAFAQHAATEKVNPAFILE